jgi:hypothetical protein
MFFKGVIIVAAIAFGVILSIVLLSYDFEKPENSFDDLVDDNSQKIIDIARQLIITSPTYSFDGIPNTLEIEIISANIPDSKFLLDGKFKTLHTGYGNRENLDLPEDITLHTILVYIVDEKIISAVIDNQWDEFNQITCNTAQC